MTAAEKHVVMKATTPNETCIEYEATPRRLYRVNGVEVPSVTTVLGVVDKSGPLIWWGQGVALEGVLELVRSGHLILRCA